MQRRTFAAGLAAVAMSGCVVEPQPQTTLIVLRHADRDTGAEDINAVGLARANALPAALAGHPSVWQGRRSARIPALNTGFDRLDRALPGGGWPLGALTELLSARAGLGELSLVLPVLARLTGRRQWVLLVDPPWIPYAPAMHGQGLDLERVLLVHTRGPEESLWACEQALRGPQDGAVLAWLDESRQPPGFARLRRLQLAARAGRKLPFLFRDSTAAGSARMSS